MKRIGYAASKIAKGNIWTYNFAVVVIASLFAVFVFLVCGLSIALTLFLLSLTAQWFMPVKDSTVWVDILKTCLTFLGMLMGILTLIALLKNIKLKI